MDKVTQALARLSRALLHKFWAMLLRRSYCEVRSNNLGAMTDVSRRKKGGWCICRLSSRVVHCLRGVACVHGKKRIKACGTCFAS